MHGSSNKPDARNRRVRRAERDFVFLAHPNFADRAFDAFLGHVRELERELPWAACGQNFQNPCPACCTRIRDELIQ